MAVWHDRGFLYRVGFIAVGVGTLHFIVGFCAPSWALHQSPLAPHQSQSMGLWQTCTGDMSVCKASLDDHNPGSLKAVRALESVAMFFAVAACIVGLYCNCVLKAQLSSSLFNKNVETSAIVSVIFGSFGLIIFSSQVKNFYSDRVGSLSWGFFIVCVANAVIGLGAFTMLISRRIMLNNARNYFSQRNNSFQSDMNLPAHAHTDQVFITTSNGYMDMGPPAYETVVNCIPQDEPAPPPYEHVVKVDD